MIDLIIHTNLKPYFKNERTLQIDCKDYQSLLSFMVNSFPEFNKLLKQIKNTLKIDFFILDANKVRVDIEDFEVNKKLTDKTYYLVPSLIGAGGKGGFMQIALGVAIMAMAFYAAPLGIPQLGISGMQATAFNIGSMAVSYMNIAMFGAQMALGGIMSIIQTVPKQRDQVGGFTDDGSKTENSMFTNTNNTAHSGVPIGVTYGMTRVGGQFVSGYIKTQNHGKSDVIKVSESFGL